MIIAPHLAMDSKAVIANAANVIVPAYLALQQKGYSVSCGNSSTADGEEVWCAENFSHRFIAEDPVTLLGLVAIYETRGEEWKASDEEIEEFLSKYQ
jgi:hypothetical protein